MWCQVRAGRPPGEAGCHWCPCVQNGAPSCRAADDAGSSPRVVDVPQGHVWLQGDNPSQSRDSRHYGPVPYNIIKMKAIAK